MSFNENPNIFAGNDTTIYAGTAITLFPSGGTTYSWSPADYLSCVDCANPTAEPIEEITYTVTGTNQYGCTNVDYITIYLDISSDVFVPNAFSPNGDGQNDVLYVRGKGFKDLTFIVYDRWGGKVFETNDKDIGWNGSFKGKDLDPGVFVYYLMISFYDNNDVIKQGNITLVR